MMLKMGLTSPGGSRKMLKNMVEVGVEQRSRSYRGEAGRRLELILLKAAPWFQVRLWIHH
jgi:hypothetical protein